MVVYVIDTDGNRTDLVLGGNPDAGEAFQAVVQAGSWFASRVKDASGYALVGCTVAPGFDFSDFSLATRAELAKLYPHHGELIAELTRT